MTENSDPYVYPGTTVLKNLRNIHDPDKLHRFEEFFNGRRFCREQQAGCWHPAILLSSDAAFTRPDLYIKSDGNVGIGTNSPAAKLHVRSATDTGIRIGAGNDNRNTALEFIENDSGSATDPGVRLLYDGTANYLEVQNASNSVNLMTIRRTGNVGIATTDPQAKLQVIGDIRVGTSGTNGCVQRFDGGSLVGSCASDMRYKTDIAPVTDVLARVAALNPVTYRMRVDEFPDRNFSPAPIKGLIAQEVETIFPELVGEDEHGYKTVEYGAQLQMLMLGAIRELKAENDGLKAENKALKAQFSAFQTRLEALEAAR